MTSPPAPRGRPEQREALLEGAVEHVLAEGVARLSLRPLAAALGTSDRMLLYYFGTRAGLMSAVLERVADRLLATLEQTLPPERLPPGELLRRLWEVARSPGADRPLRLYLELAGLAASGGAEFTDASSAVTLGWLGWARARVDVPEAERSTVAAGVMAALDGLLLLRAVDPAAADAAITWLARDEHQRGAERERWPR